VTAFPPLSFEAVVHQFRQRGIVITSSPGEYSVNYLNGKADTAALRETLNEAVLSELGHSECEIRTLTALDGVNLAKAQISAR
jgi:hypothetical protein